MIGRSFFSLSQVRRPADDVNFLSFDDATGEERVKKTRKNRRRKAAKDQEMKITSRQNFTLPEDSPPASSRSSVAVTAGNVRSPSSTGNVRSPSSTGSVRSTTGSAVRSPSKQGNHVVCRPTRFFVGLVLPVHVHVLRCSCFTSSYNDVAQGRLHITCVRLCSVRLGGTSVRQYTRRGVLSGTSVRGLVEQCAVHRRNINL